MEEEDQSMALRREDTEIEKVQENSEAPVHKQQTM